MGLFSFTSSQRAWRLRLSQLLLLEGERKLESDEIVVGIFRILSVWDDDNYGHLILAATSVATIMANFIQCGSSSS